MHILRITAAHTNVLHMHDFNLLISMNIVVFIDKQAIDACCVNLIDRLLLGSVFFLLFFVSLIHFTFFSISQFIFAFSRSATMYVFFIYHLDAVVFFYAACVFNSKYNNNKYIFCPIQLFHTSINK